MTDASGGGVPWLRVPRWAGTPRLLHGFAGRFGGVSRGGFAELNLSSRVGDDPEAVQQNWQRVARASGTDVRFVAMRQVHGTRIVCVDNPMAAAEDADAMVTRTRGIALSVLTADCVPILLLAPRQQIVAAIHAGWRGTVAGIVLRAVEYIEHAWDVKADELSAALGPAIGGCCYQVDRSIVDDLERRWGKMADCVERSNRLPSKAQLDLRRANTALLLRAGVRAEGITSVGPCTRCASSDYFSYRAAAGPTGRQLSFIGWQD